MSEKLNAGDSFPTLTLNLVGGDAVSLPGELESGYHIILFYRGHWWPYCRRQLGGFEDHLQELEGINAKVIAASAEPQDKAIEVAADLSFPVAFGVTRAQTDKLGSWWEERRQIIQPSNFVLNDAGKVLSATYSTGPIGRLEPADAIRFVQFQEKQKQAKG